jgi:hypothetical protein
MTPPRLTELRCPGCQQLSWVIDSDYRGMGDDVPYAERLYACVRCGHDGMGWVVCQQSPPAFFLQPHPLYPMTQVAFDYWVNVLKTHFPSDRHLAYFGARFRPCLPEEAEAIRQEDERARPVAEMRDQDGARRVKPTIGDADDWLDMMTPGDTLELRRHDGGCLKLTLDGTEHSAICLDPAGEIAAHATGLDELTVREAVQRYLSGRTDLCASYLRKAPGS